MLGSGLGLPAISRLGPSLESLTALPGVGLAAAAADDGLPAEEDNLTSVIRFGPGFPAAICRSGLVLGEQFAGFHPSLTSALEPETGNPEFGLW